MKNDLVRKQLIEKIAAIGTKPLTKPEVVHDTRLTINQGQPQPSTERKVRRAVRLKTA